MTDPKDLPFPDDDDEPTDVPVANPDAVAEADEDSTDGDTTTELAEDDPNKSW